MARDQNQASPPQGYAALARRMAAWTSNSLLTLMILLIGIGFGRQVLIWWGDDASESGPSDAPQAADGFGDPERLHLLQFGGSAWSIRRQSFHGDQAAASLALQASCTDILGGLPLPDGPAGAAETRLLAGLAGRKPVAEQSGSWRLYQWEEGVPMMAGVRQSPPIAGGAPRMNLATPAPRVVIWGLAVPMGTEGWTLYTFQPSGSTGEPFSPLPDVPLPPECRRTLALRVVGGGGMVMFEGPPPPPDWPESCRQWFVQRGWKPAAGWTRVGSTWHARFNAPPEDPLASVDLRYGVDEQGQGRGLILATPRLSILRKSTNQ